MVQTTERLVSTDAQRYLLVYMIAVLVIVTGLVVLFFTVFQKRKNRMLLDKIKREREFEETLIKTQSEIQEQTLKNVGQELHDNVGQLLAVANMQLSLVASLTKDSLKNRVDETKDVISDAIKEVRGLSKVLNSEVISNFGLQQSIKNEIDRLNKLKKIYAHFNVDGEAKKINSKDAIILFRIFQEFITNTIKYANAKNFSVQLSYHINNVVISAKDDGKGFDENQVEKGSGLINMKDRARLINTKYILKSKPNEGTELKLVYPLNQY